MIKSELRRTILCRDPEEDHAEAVDQEEALAEVAAALAAVTEAEATEVADTEAAITAADTIAVPTEEAIITEEAVVLAVLRLCLLPRWF